LNVKVGDTRASIWRGVTTIALAIVAGLRRRLNKAPHAKHANDRSIIGESSAARSPGTLEEVFSFYESACLQAV
jgi:hypothetical protein